MGAREEILKLVRKYYSEKFGSRKFDPGSDLIHYAGRVFDEQELVNLVDSSLDFFLTANRYAEQFENRFAEYLGFSNALLAEKVAVNPKLHGEAFNFSNETPVSVLEIVERITKIMCSNLKPAILNEASNEIREQYLSSSKARKMLKWKPLVTLDEGLEQTITWYREFSGK